MSNKKIIVLLLLVISNISLVMTAGSCSGYTSASAPCTQCQCFKEVSTTGAGWKTLNTGNWGGWKTAQYAPSNEYLGCGAQIRADGDDTGANGLKIIFCKISSWNTQTTKTVWNGNWGSWKSTKMCPPNSFIEGGQSNYEGKQGAFGDDSALNGLKIKCSGGSWIDLGGTNKGSWKTTVTVPGQYLCGAQVQYEDPCGSFCDDTAMNGVKFQFCSKKCDDTRCTACGNKYYLESNDCKSCNFPCENCSSASACTSCASGYLLGNSQCKTCSNWIPFCDECHDFSNCKTCHDGYYLSGGICKPCEHPCVFCTSATNCTSCVTGAIGNNREDASLDCQCVSTHTEIAATKVCEACLYPCASCTGTTQNCTVCSTLANRGNAPDCLCDNGYFDNNSYCDTCESPCKNCTSKSACLSCVGDLELGGTECKACNVWKPNCISCADFETCTTCEENFYVDGSDSCIQCTIQGCADCSDPAVCTKAAEGWVLVAPSNIPIPCLFPCTKCVGFPNNCLECVVSDPVRITNKCSCPDGFYDDGYTEQCQQCMPECETCTRGDQCQFLKECDGQCGSCLVHPSNCASCKGDNRQPYPSCKCLSKFFESGGEHCQRCESPCLTCTAFDYCTSCENPLLRPPECKGLLDGWWASVDTPNAEQAEGKCSIQCERCQNAADNCLSCQGKNRVMEAPKCECLSGFHDENGTSADCAKCPKNCIQCSSQDNCTVCDEENGMTLNEYNGKCECGAGFTFNLARTKCEKCFMYQGECFIQCPKSTLADEETQTCLEVFYEHEDHFYTILFPALSFVVIFAVLALATRRMANKALKSAERVPKSQDQTQQQQSDAGLLNGKKQSVDFIDDSECSQKSEIEVIEQV